MTDLSSVIRQISVSGDPAGGGLVQFSASALSYDGSFGSVDALMTGGAGDNRLFAYSGPADWAAFNPTGSAAFPLHVDCRVLGMDGNDRLYSSDGLSGLTADQQAVYSHSDVLEGGLGDDIYTLSYLAVSVVEAEDSTGGIDTIKLTQSFLDAFGTEVFHLDTYANVENLTILGTTALEVVATSDDNLIKAGAGDDTINSVAGNDTVFGGLGIDVLLGQAGDERLSGGDGGDFIYGGIGGADTLLGGAGDDNISAGGDDDVLRGDDGNDVISGNNGNNTITGGAGDDVLFSGSGNDVLRGGEGANYLDAGEGDDYLGGGTGNDSLVAGGGNDTINATGGGDDLTDGGIGDDLYLVSTTTVSINETASTFHGIDTVSSDTLNLASSSYANIEILKLRGTANLDLTGGYATTLIGNDGDNHITAGSFASDMQGGAGDDTIVGSQLDDTINGGLGNDSLDGGAGADIFVFDTIDPTLPTVTVNFASGDKIDLSAFGLEKLFDGNYPPSDAFTPGSPAAACFYTESKTFVFVDLNGDNTLDMYIELLGDHYDLRFSDFLTAGTTTNDLIFQIIT
jgi:Ca2+-binding RTX toxin-like protein